MTIWQTHAVTTAPAGIWVRLKTHGGEEEFELPAVALLHQIDHSRGVDRVVIGVLNPHRGEIEAVNVDDDDNDVGQLVAITVHGELLS